MYSLDWLKHHLRFQNHTFPSPQHFLSALVPFGGCRVVLWALERAKETLTWFWISLKFSIWSLKQSRTLISPDIAPKLKEAYTMSKVQLCFSPDSIQNSFFSLLFYFLKPYSELFQPAVICHFFNNWMTIITASFWGRTQVAENQDHSLEKINK